GIDHVEGDQPAHHRAGDHYVNIQRDQGADEVEELEHGVPLRDRRSGFTCNGTRPQGQGEVWSVQPCSTGPAEPRFLDNASTPNINGATFGAVAQMGERCNRTAEVRGSIPLGSTSPALPSLNPLENFR